MRFLSIAFLSLFISLAYSKNVVDLKKIVDALDKRGLLVEQPLFQEPPHSDKNNMNGIFIPAGEEPQRGQTLLTSSISINKNISFFARYVRDNVEISSRFNDRTKQSIVFAPSDLAISSLPMKPWQFPLSIDDTKTAEETDSIIASNLNDFVQSHVVDGEIPFEALDEVQKGVKFISMNGNQIKFVSDDGEYYVTVVLDGRDLEWLKVQSVTTVDNGAILVVNKPFSTPLTKLK